MGCGVVRRPWWHVLATIVSATALGALAACGGSSEPAAAITSQTWEDVVAQAKQEGKVSVYGAASQSVLTSISEGFEAKYGIKVDALLTPAGPQHERVSQSLQARQVQVDVLINNDTPFLDELVTSDALQDIQSIPNHAAFPADWWPGAYPLVASFTQAVLVNTNLVDPTSITSWADLLKPEYKGKIAAISPSSGLGSLTFYANLVDSQGEDYVTKLAAQEPTLVSTSAEGSQLVAAGDKAIYLNNVAYNTVPLKANGAPVDDVYLPPVSVVAYAAVAMKDGPHPAAGRLFVDWLVSPEGQQAVCGRLQLTCSTEGIADSLPLPDRGSAADIGGKPTCMGSELRKRVFA